MSQTDKERVITELLNGETSVYVKCALNLGYDAGYRAAKEDAAKVASETIVVIEAHLIPMGGQQVTANSQRVAAEIRKLKPEGQ